MTDQYGQPASEKELEVGALSASHQTTPKFDSGTIVSDEPASFLDQNVAVLESREGQSQQTTPPFSSLTQEQRIRYVEMVESMEDALSEPLNAGDIRRVKEGVYIEREDDGFRLLLASEEPSVIIS